MFFCLRFSSSGHCTFFQFVHTRYSLRLYCSFAGRVYLWIEYCEVPRCCRECNMRAHLLHCHWTNIQTPNFSVCKSQLTIQPNHEVTCAGAVMKTLPALLCCKSPHQTLFTALFPICPEGFAASSASGNLSPQTQLTFLTEDGATENFICDQFCSPTRYDWPFSSDPNQCLLPLTCLYFLPCTYLFMQPDSQVSPCPMQRGQVCTSAQDVSKVRSNFFE